MVAITGNTYPVKDQLKTMGGRWNPEEKAWMVPSVKVEAAKALVAGSKPTQKETLATDWESSLGPNQRKRLADAPAYNKAQAATWAKNEQAKRLEKYVSEMES